MRIGSGGEPVKGKKAAGIFFTDGHKVLLLKRSQEGDHGGTWALPGGKAKDGESEISNAIRETKEECGLGSIPGYRIDSLSSHNGHQKFTGFVYRVTEPFQIRLSKEHTDWDWVDLNNLKSKDLHPKFKEQIPRYISAIKRKINKFSEWVQYRESVS